MASSTLPQTLNPTNVKKPNPSYSHCCVTPILPGSKFITIAGQTGLRDDGTTAPDMASQAKEACQSLLDCLKAVGATPRDIVSVNHYVVRRIGDPELDKQEVVFRGWNEVWMDFMDREAGGHRPPGAAFGVVSMARDHIYYEVEVTAIVSG
ncbi:hypothetical protein J1614_002725 [Plenodomus biglobosus]|nr:hypothetical protein J1614_002725 [Plenodomus biglobosus]